MLFSLIPVWFSESRVRFSVGFPGLVAVFLNLWLSVPVWDKLWFPTWQTFVFLVVAKMKFSTINAQLSEDMDVYLKLNYIHFSDILLKLFFEINNSSLFSVLCYNVCLLDFSPATSCHIKKQPLASLPVHWISCCFIFNSKWFIVMKAG